MSYFHERRHISRDGRNFRNNYKPSIYGMISGTVEISSEHPITGHSGEHLRFYVDIQSDLRYQVDINTQSNDGSRVEFYSANENLKDLSSTSGNSFGNPAYGIFDDAQLSYAGLGLKDSDFTPVDDIRITNQLEQTLNKSSFVQIYGFMFDDGGDNGKGIHETHYNYGKTNQDGAIAIYYLDSNNNPNRTWFFFKFQGDSIS